MINSFGGVVVWAQSGKERPYHRLSSFPQLIILIKSRWNQQACTAERSAIR
jgi:hypothetical protein